MLMAANSGICAETVFTKEPHHTHHQRASLADDVVHHLNPFTQQAT